MYVSDVNIIPPWDILIILFPVARGKTEKKKHLSSGGCTGAGA
jgi:hypothetical protein